MVPDSISLGPCGVTVAPGDHVCVFYASLAERDEILLPYLRGGLRSGEKCICTVDTTEPDALLADLGAEVELKPALDRQQLEVARTRDVFQRDGGFAMEGLVEYWERNMGISAQKGFSFTRAAGDMTWALLQLPGKDFMTYESMVNRFLSRHPQAQASLCFYQLDRCGGEPLVHVVKTHPKTLLGGMVLDNPYYLDPDEFLGLRR